MFLLGGEAWYKDECHLIFLEGLVSLDFVTGHDGNAN